MAFSCTEVSKRQAALFMDLVCNDPSQKSIVHQSPLSRPSISVPEPTAAFSFRSFQSLPFPSCLQNNAVTLGNCVLT